jgi:serine/threonine-protein kinase
MQQVPTQPDVRSLEYLSWQSMTSFVHNCAIRRGASAVPMICPYCQADNSEHALECNRCGRDLSGMENPQTPGGDDVTASPGVPAYLKPSAAAALATTSGKTASDDRPVSSFTLTAAILAPGTAFGPRYRIECLLGQGGMGAVYKAYDKDLNRVVALKLVRPELTSDASSMQRFKQELLLASKISHKNILRIHDLGDAEGVKFISMAYVEGEDLHHALEREGRLPVRRALKIARQLCAGLDAAHREGVVHRDLKPQNILIDGADNAYVSDFGLAKSLQEGAALSTRTGAVLGTPRYMSPEQVQGKPADHRTDIYSLGLILYEMTTGDVPFKGDSAFQEMYQRVTQEPKSPKELNPELPDYLVRIILRCLERDTGLRYQQARDVLHDLESEVAPTPSRGVHIWLPVPTGSWVLAAGALVALMVIALAIPSVRHSILRRPTQTAVGPAGIPPLTQGKYVAVLPFRVLGDEESLRYIAEGLSESLTAKLFQLKGVHVASSAATEKAGEKDPPEKVAQELGANLLVHGTVHGMKVEGELRKIAIIVSLDDVSSGRRLWSGQVSGEAQDLLTLEDQIGSKLVSTLEPRLSGAEPIRGAHPTENVEAYELYLKGRNALRGEENVKSTQAAVDFFQAALNKDANFALAYAGLADASLAMYHSTKESLWEQKALNAAQQAQQLNDELADVHFSLGGVYNATGRVAESILELDRALELSPNSEDGYRRLGSVYLASGREDEAFKAYQKAIEINPYYWQNYNALGTAYFQVGDYEKALSAWRRVTELEPDNSTGYENMGDVYFRQGKYNDCVQVFKKALELSPRYDNYSNLGTAYFYLKRYDEAVTMFEKAVQLNPNEQEYVGDLADAYRWSGHPEKAQSTYDKAIALGYKELQINPRKADVMADMALYYAKKGNTAEALALIRRARSIDGNDVYFIHNQGVIEAIAGHPQEALKTLREAFHKGYPPNDAENDPELKDLRARPEFGNLVKEFSSKTR